MNVDEMRKFAYSVVFEDLKQYNLFCGIYDAKNENESFMNGVQTVMENIAYNICEEVGEDFSITFTKNIIKSIDKANKM